MRLFGKVALLAMVLGLGFAAVAAGADAVRLHPQAVVASGTQVTLGDVAELEGPAARALRGLVVARFPAVPEPVGKKVARAAEVVVPIDTVLRHLDAAAVNLSLLTVKGARSCRVVNGVAQDVEPVPVTPAPAKDPAAPVAIAPAVPAQRAEATAPTLAQRVNARLVALTGAEPGALTVTFRGAAEAAGLLNAPAPAGDVEITLESRTGLGRVPVRVRRFAADGQVFETRLTADVVREMGAVVVTAPIRRGERFSSDNVAVQRTDLSRGHGTPVVDLAQVLGRSASATLRVGMPVIERHLAPDVLVKRGDLVTVTVRRGRLSIRTVGRAIEDGERGAIVALRNDATREQFYATVTGPRRAAITSTDQSPQ